MRRSRISRALGAGIALLLVFATQQEAVGFMHCPHHGMGMGMGTGMGMGMGMAMSGAHAAMQDMSPAGGRHAPAHKGCTCVGACCSAPAMLQGSVSGGLTWTAAVRDAVPSVLPDPRAPRFEPRLHPFATAPPASFVA